MNDVAPSAAKMVSGLEPYCPVTTIFPAESILTELAMSAPVPPIVLAHNGVPAESYFTTNTSLPPKLVKVVKDAIPSAR